MNDDNSTDTNHNGKGINTWKEDGVYIYRGGTVHRYDKKKIIHLIVEPYVTTIHCHAFERCKLLETIQFTNSTISALEEIDNHAFYECTSLKSISYLPSSVWRIGKQAFFRCTKLTIGTIGNDCTSTSLLLPSSLRIIEKKAFYWCEELTSIIFPKSLEKLGFHSFFYCTKLKVVQFLHSHTTATTTTTTTTTDNKLKEIPYGTFGGCCRLETVLLDCDSIKFIGKEVFKGCDKLTHIQLPKSLEHVGNAAFFGCSMLRSIELPTNGCLKQIGPSAFECCSQLESIILPGSIQKMGIGSFFNCLELKSVKALSPMKVIANSAFEYCKSLQYVELPSTIEVIERNAFSRCPNLQNVQFSYLKPDGKVVVAGATEVETYDMEYRQLKVIDDAAFWGCVELTGMTIPACIEAVGPYAFEDCTKLKDENQDMYTTNAINILCDMNRGGLKFLQRRHDHDDDHYHHHDDDDDNVTHRTKLLHYPSSLWPLILNRVLNEMKFPIHTICGNGENIYDGYTNDIPVRRSTVVYSLMVNGIVMDLSS